MKKIILSFMMAIAIVGSALAGGEKVQGDFSVLKGQQVNVVYDYSQVDIAGKWNDATYPEKNSEWETIKVEAYDNSVQNILMEIPNSGMTVGHFPDAQYTLRFVVLRVKSEGRTFADVILTDKDGKELGSIKGFDEKGGGGMNSYMPFSVNYKRGIGKVAHRLSTLLKKIF